MSFVNNVEPSIDAGIKTSPSMCGVLNYGTQIVCISIEVHVVF